MVAWQPIGISMGVFDVCHRYGPVHHFLVIYMPHHMLFHTLLFCTNWNRYLKERKQFGVPLVAFQLNQEKLVRMLGNIQAMLLVGWRLCKLYESGKMTPGHASLGKVCEILAGKGCLSSSVTRTLCSFDISVILTFDSSLPFRVGLPEWLVRWFLSVENCWVEMEFWLIF